MPQILVGYLFCPPVDAVVSVVMSNKKTWGDKSGTNQWSWVSFAVIAGG